MQAQLGSPWTDILPLGPGRQCRAAATGSHLKPKAQLCTDPTHTRNLLKSPSATGSIYATQNTLPLCHQHIWVCEGGETETHSPLEPLVTKKTKQSQKFRILLPPNYIYIYVISVIDQWQIMLIANIWLLPPLLKADRVSTKGCLESTPKPLAIDVKKLFF